MFGYISADLKDLNEDRRCRYSAVYCGVCRRIRQQAGQTARLTLQYDMAFSRQKRRYKARREAYSFRKIS